MNTPVKKFLTHQDTIAVVGVSLDSRKYGNKVFHDLLNKNYKVYAIHPGGGKINGQIRYKSLSNLPQKPDLIVSVVKPEITEKIILECVKMGIKKIWMQPGSESQKAIDLCHQHKIEVLSNACVML